MFKRFYIWQGVDLYHKQQFGSQFCSSRQKLIANLNKLGICKSQVDSIPESIREKQLSSAELILFIQNILSFLKAGISFQETLMQIFFQFKSPLIRYICCIIYTRIHLGESLSASFQGLNKNFPPFFLSMIKLAQLSGNLESGLQDCLDFYERMEQRKKKLREIISYPLFVLGFTLLLVLVILFAVIPMFQGVYRVYGDDLPILTKIAVALSDFLRSSYLEILAVLAVLLVLKKYSKITWLNPLYIFNHFNNKITHQLLDPFLFSYSLSILLAQALPLDSSLKVIGTMLTEDNKDKIDKIISLLHKGNNFCDSCKEVNFYWNDFSIFLITAEKSGDLSKGFLNIYKFWDKKFDVAIKIISQVSHFFIIAFAAFIILLIFLSIYLPLFELGTRSNL